MFFSSQRINTTLVTLLLKGTRMKLKLISWIDAACAEHEDGTAGVSKCIELQLNEEGIMGDDAYEVSLILNDHFCSYVKGMVGNTT